MGFAEENSLVIEDTRQLPRDTATFISAASGVTSWLDHVLIRKGLGNELTQYQVLNVITITDHLLLTFLFNGKTEIDSDIPEGRKRNWPDWENASEAHIAEYGITIINAMVSYEQIKDLDLCYNRIIDTINEAALMNIPSKHARGQVAAQQVPGWNDLVKGLHDEAREAFLQWRSNGNPRYGPIYQQMISTRLTFKAAFRRYRFQEQQAQADVIGCKLLNHPTRQFWKEVQKLKPSPKPNTMIDDCTSESGIAELWARKYQRLFNSVPSGADDAKGTDDRHPFPCISSTEVLTAISEIDNKTVIDEDGLSMEHFRNAPDIVLDWLAALFNRILAEGSLPERMISATLIPLLKDRLGDRSCSDNYRAIAISPTVAKILECILLNRVKPFLHTDPAQFGFTADGSTSTASLVLDATIDHYKKRGSAVYIAFLDAAKAFDRVPHGTLFRSLQARGVPAYIISILREWYAKQGLSVRWGNTLSKKFTVTNGVRQGGSLSPLLFNVYIDYLIRNVRNSRKGCHLNWVPCNIFAYADDLVLLAPKRSTLQWLLDRCSGLADEISLLFNNKKSIIMVANGGPCVALTLKGEELSFTDSYRYLGHIVEKSGNQDLDVSRLRRSFFAAYASIMHQFSHCSIPVKVALFKAHCTHFYGCELWTRLSKKSCHSVEVSLHAAIKRMLGLKRTDRNSMACENVNLLTFDRTVAYRQILLFKSITSTSNSMVEAMVKSVDFCTTDFFARITDICRKYGIMRMNLAETSKSAIRNVFASDQRRYISSLPLPN